MIVQQKSINVGANEKATLSEKPKNNSKNTLLIASVGAVAFVAIAAVAYTFFRPECGFEPINEPLLENLQKQNLWSQMDKAKKVLDSHYNECPWFASSSKLDAMKKGFDVCSNKSVYRDSAAALDCLKKIKGFTWK